MSKGRCHEELTVCIYKCIIPFFLTEIELVSETTAEEAMAAEGAKPDLTQGVTVAYTKPVPQVKIFFYLKEDMIHDL